MRKVILIIFCFSWLLNLEFKVMAQEGSPFLKNYTIPLSGLINQYYSSVQGPQGRMFFANIYGIVEYNGHNWRVLNTPSTPYVLAYGAIDSSIIFVGCNKGYGYLKQNANLQFEYVSLADSTINGDAISQILILKNAIAFCSKSNIAVWSSDLKPSYTIKDKEYSGFFEYKNTIYASLKDKGLFINKGEKLELYSSDTIFKNTHIVANISVAEKKMLGFSNSSIMLFDENGLTSFKYDAELYVSSNLLTGLLKYTNAYTVVSTRSGGCVILNNNTGNTRAIINYQCGLPDDEIQSMCIDNQSGLWLNHSLGASRVDFNMKIISLASFQGLSGIPASMVQFNNTFYVSTSEGLFYLSRVENFTEVENLIRKEQQRTELSVQRYTTIKKIKKFIDVEFFEQENHTEKAEAVKYKLPVTFEIPVDSISTTIQDVFKDEKIRQLYAVFSIPFVFKKVTGLDAKCKQIVISDNKLIVGTNIGLFEISNNKAYQIRKDYYINHILPSDQDSNTLFIAHNRGMLIVEKQNGKWIAVDSIQNGYSVSNITLDKKYIWLGTTNSVVRVERNTNGSIKKTQLFLLQSNYSEDIITCSIEKQTAFLSITGIYRWDEKNNRISKLNNSLKTGEKIKLLNNQPKYTWLKQGRNYVELNENYKSNSSKLQYLKLFNDITDIYIGSNQKMWFICESQMYYIDTGSIDYPNYAFSILINSIEDKNHYFISDKNIFLKHNNNGLNIEVSSLYFKGEDMIEYQYRIEGLQSEWTSWTKDNKIVLSYIPSGEHRIQIRARNVFGEISTEYSLEFTVKRAIWENLWFYFFIAIIIGLLIYMIVRLRVQQLKNANILLQNKIDVATAEIRHQKDEIERKNKNITDSIEYAKRIQQAILPLESSIKEALPDSFVFYQPRDIVSGDFFWFYTEAQRIIIIAGDCTGHGVPGAFMSMIGNTLLNEIIKERNITDPSQILTQLDAGIIKALKQDIAGIENNDGMDMALCSIDFVSHKILFGGAKNPLILIRNNELQEFDGDRFPVGGRMLTDMKKVFTTQELPLIQGSSYYIFSDGYADQNGGPKNGKFNSGRLYKLLTEISAEPMDQQYIRVKNNMTEWQMSNPQRDDMLVIGFKL